MAKAHPKRWWIKRYPLVFNRWVLVLMPLCPSTMTFVCCRENLDAYVAAIQEQKARSDIEVYLGLEIDFIAGLTTPNDAKWDVYPLDYKIGSVHTLQAPNEQYPMLSVDGPREEFKVLLGEVHEGSARSMIEAYYQRIRELCEAGGFDILGHYDLVKKHNKALDFFSEQEDWYQNVAIATLDAVAKAGVILEVNYGGMLRGATDDVYPSPWLLKHAKSKNIPVQINADAHAPHHLGVYHEKCREVLLEAGYQQQRILLDGKWQDVSIL